MLQKEQGMKHNILETSCVLSSIHVHCKCCPCLVLMATLQVSFAPLFRWKHLRDIHLLNIPALLRADQGSMQVFHAISTAASRSPAPRVQLLKHV